MGYGSRRWQLVCLVIVAFWVISTAIAGADGNQWHRGAAGPLSFSGPDRTAGNQILYPDPPGRPGPSSFHFTDRLLQGIVPIPSYLRFGYLYDGGPKFSAGRLTLDGFVPIRLGKRTRLFGQAQGSFQDFWRTIRGESSNRIDLSFGGGIRQIIGDTRYVGVNAFYDTTRLAGNWYSSGGLGLEMWGNLAGSDTIDLSFNYYGDLFIGPNNIVDAFRRGKGNYDIEAGYSHPLLDESLELRLKLRGYAFDSGDRFYGWATGCDLTTSDRLLSLRYEIGQDRLSGTYHTVGGFLSVGFDLGNLAEFGNPFVRRRPIYGSPPDPYVEADNREVHRQFFGPGGQSLSVLTRQAQGCLFFRTVPSHVFPFNAVITQDPQPFAAVDRNAITTLEVSINHASTASGEPLGLALNDAAGVLIAVIVPGGTFTSVSPGPVTNTFIVNVAGLAADPAQLELFTSGGVVAITWSATLCFR